MMKTYKTWEMIKAIIENPKKKYRPVNCTDGHVEFKNNQLVWKGHSQSGQAMIVTGTDEYEWVEVEESVDFITAIKSGKRVRVEHPKLDKQVDDIANTYLTVDNVLLSLGANCVSSAIRDIISNGKWYIED